MTVDGTSRVRPSRSLERALAVAVAAWSLAPWLGAPRALARGWLPLVLVAGAFALWRRIGARATLVAAAVCAAAGSLLEAVAIADGGFAHRLPSGRHWAAAGWAAYQLPVVAVALHWLGRATPAALCAAALLSLSIGLVSDPVGLVDGFWSYPRGGAYVDHLVAFDGSRGIPIWNYFSWLSVPVIATGLASHARATGRVPVADSPWLAPVLVSLLFGAAAVRGLREPLVAGGVGLCLTLLALAWGRRTR